MSEKDVSSTDTSFESSVDVGKQVNDNLQTWPRTQLGAVGKVRKEFNECLENENLLNRAKAFLLSAADEGGSHQELRSTIQSLCQLIDEGNRLKAAKMRAQTNGMLDAKSADGSRRPSISAQRRNSGTRPKQQQMQSMILCKIPGATAPKPRKSSVGGPTPAILQGLQKVPDEEERDEQQRERRMEAGGEDADAAQQPKPAAAVEEAAAEPVSMPWILRVLPNVSIVLSALLYLIVGAIMFRWLDDDMAKKPFRWAVILAFETCTTIGWGDSKPTNRWSQAFCTLYTVFGVPIVFCAFANVGRLISPYYTIDWLLLTGVVRKKAHGSQHRLPMKRALNFLFLHQFVGTLLYSGLFKDLPVITAIYFSVTSMGTIGIGDYHPDTESGAEAVVALLYIGIGIILLSALLLSINFYYQTFFFIWLRDKLHDCWSAKMIEKKVHSYPKSNLA